MGNKKIIKKFARFILASQPKAYVSVNIASINYGGILSNKKIIITGGGSGLGFAMAQKFIAEGAEVLIAGRRKQVLDDAVANLGSRCHAVVFDVCDVENADEFIRKADKELKGIDILVNNAGLSLHENHFSKVTLEGFDKQFNTNFRGGYFLGKAFLEYKLSSEDKEGQLLFITSETGDQCYDIPYGMTKSALNSLVGALSRRVYKEGIRVNAIAPGVTLTDMTKEYAESADGNLFRDCASGRTFIPEEIAEVACFLLSDASKCISGEIIHCNAGNHLKTFWDESK